MLYLEPKDKKELLTILMPLEQYDIRAYGSRVKGTHHKNSDLDLCYMQEMPWTLLDDLREQLTESNLPFFVTIVPWKSFDDSFKNSIKKDLLPLKQW